MDVLDATRDAKNLRLVLVSRGLLKKAGQWVCRHGRFANVVLQDSIVFVYDRMNEVFVVQKIYIRRHATAASRHYAPLR